MKQHKIKMIFSLLLTALFAMQSITVSFADEFAPSTEDGQSLEPKQIYIVESEPSEYGQTNITYCDEYGNEVVPQLIPDNEDKSAGIILPSSYDSRDYDLITPVKNQGTTSSCWAHAMIACAESSMIKKGYATNSIDYSESHLVWFARGVTPADTNDPMYGDGNVVGSNCYDVGSNFSTALSTLARWSGVELEENTPSVTEREPFDESERYKSYAHLQNAFQYSATDLDSIKQALMDNGALNVSYYHDSNYCSKGTDYAAYYTGTAYSINPTTNHAVTIVGWDDNFDKAKFKGVSPDKNGAWLIKNSWGTNSSSTYNGYFYMSYYEPTIGYIWSADMERVDNYDTAYQYDGYCYNYYYYNKSYVSGANIFTAKNNNPITAVAFYTNEATVPYTISIYKNVTASNPTSGELVHTQSGTQDYAGYHTVKLASPVSIPLGSNFSVVVALKKEQTGMYVDKYSKSTGQSFLTSGSATSSSSWHDLNQENANVCIKAFAKSASSASDSITLYGERSELNTTLSWSAVNNATIYRIQRKSTDSSWQTIGTSTMLSYADFSTANGTTYTYRILAYNDDGLCACSNEITLKPPATPLVLNASEGSDSVSLSWNTVTGATRYKVQRKDSNDSWTSISTGSDKSFTDTNVTGGIRYTYRVLAYNGTKFIVSSNKVGASVALQKPILTATLEQNRITLTWTAVPGVQMYQVQSRTDSTEWSVFMNTNALRLTTSLTSGEISSFRVRAKYNDSFLIVSNTVSAQLESEAPTLTASAANNSVGLSWDSVDGATKYTVLRKEQSGLWHRLADNVTGTSLSDDTAVNGTEYSYCVHAKSDEMFICFSNIASATPSIPTTPTKPLNVNAKAGDGKVTITWEEPITGATKYIIKRKDGESWIKVDETSGLSYTVTGLTNGVEYTFMISSVIGTNIGPTSVIVYSTPSAVQKGTVVITPDYDENKIYYSWADTGTATKCKIYYREKGDTEWSTTTVSTSITNSSFSFGAALGVTYEFAITLYIDNEWQELDENDIVNFTFQQS